MFLRIHTLYAPWTIIEGNCKRYAQVKALDGVITAIEARIDPLPLRRHPTMAAPTSQIEAALPALDSPMRWWVGCDSA